MTRNEAVNLKTPVSKLRADRAYYRRHALAIRLKVKCARLGYRISVAEARRIVNRYIDNT